jgi:outer membrane usher protein FimD/PapC
MPARGAEFEPDLIGLVTLGINGQMLGDFEIGILADEPILTRELLAQILNLYLRPDIYDTIINAAFLDIHWISKKEIELVGIGWEWDISRIALNLRIPPSYSPVVDIDGSSLYTMNIKPILKPSPVSGYVNLRASGAADLDSTGSSFPMEASLSGQVNILSWIALGTGSMTYTSTGFTGNISGYYLLKDLPAINARLSLGKVYAPGLSYQSQPELLGFSLKSEEIIKYRVKPGYSELFSEFTIEKTSVVRIILNGSVYRTTTMRPGNYRLLDLPFTYGLNDFILEIEDEEGKVSSRRVIIPREMNLLVQDTADFAISAGVGSTQTNLLMASAYYRYGFSPRFTAGLYGQSDLRSLLGGINFVHASLVGNWSGGLAGVGAWDGRSSPLSFAGNLQYRFSLPGRDRVPSFGISAEYSSTGFTAPSFATIPSPTMRALRLSGQIGGRLGKSTSLNVSGSWSTSLGAGSSDLGNLSMSLSRSFRAGVSMSLIANVNMPQGRTPVINASLMLFIIPKDRPGRSLSYIQTSQGSSSISVSEKLDLLGGIDLSARGNNLLLGTSSGSTIGLSAKKSLSMADLALSGDFEYQNPSSTRIGRIRLSANTALAFAGPYFAFNRSIDDAFMLFVPKGEMKNEIVYVRVDGSGTATSMRGRPLILPITSYKATVVNIDMPEASPEILPRIQTALLAPNLRSGILLVADIVKRYRVSGTLLNREGAKIGYLAGDIVDMGGSHISSTFTDEEGYFEVYDLLPGDYYIEWPSSIGISQFSLEENAQGELSLGPIRATLVEAFKEEPYP